MNNNKKLYLFATLASIGELTAGLVVSNASGVEAFTHLFRSNKEIYAQLIDDVAGRTLASASSMEKGFQKQGTKTDVAVSVGKLIAERAKVAGVETVVFDRNGYLYHGRVKALADAARENGLKF